MRSASASLQGQDESDETRETLESCNAIGGAIEFTSVIVDPIKVLWHCAICLYPPAVSPIIWQKSPASN